MRENYLRWYEYVVRRPANTITCMRRGKIITNMRRGGGRHKETLIKTICKDLNIFNLTKDVTLYGS